MPQRILNHPSEGVIGWRARQDRARAKTAERHASTAMRAQRASIHRRDDARKTYDAAVDRRDKMAASVSSLESMLATMEAISLQSGKVVSGQMHTTFSLAASRKALVVAEAEVISTKEAFVSAQKAMDADHARQRAEAAAEQQDDLDEPVAVPAVAVPAPPKFATTGRRASR